MIRRFELHEFCLGGFLLVMTLWLFAARGIAEPLVWLFGGQFAGTLLLAVWASRRPDSAARWRCRLAWCAIVINVSYVAMRSAVPAVHPASFDSLLSNADIRILGAPIAVLTKPITHAWLTEVLNFCYFIFYPWLISVWLRFSFRDAATIRRLCAGIFTIYGVGFFGYLLVPAAGPQFFAELAPVLNFPLEGGFFTRLQNGIVENGCNRVDAFPSLHCAVSAFLLWFDWHHARRAFFVMLTPCIGLWFSTVYLRHHYLIDVIAGFALTAATIATIRIWEKNRTSS
jgi:membrane-associated phospholipid phosphatase